MKMSKSIQINAPASVVWHIVAHEFEDVSKWASSVTHSIKTSGHLIPENADVSGRICTSSYGNLTEAFTHFDEANMIFTYKAEGQPFFIKGATNTWKVEAIGEQACVASFSPEIEFIPMIGIIMRFPMQIFIRSVLKETLEELKYCVETGEVHPRKEQAMAKAMRKAIAN